ncbi:hypothetical protein PAXRUDRAFT_179210, partial [Paxillus rubicundulus Ve08.2h10]
VHYCNLAYCNCPGSPDPHIQLLGAGLFPASTACPSTVFTLKVLDDFLRDNVECGTAAMNYFSKLKRITSNVFPHLVPVRSSVGYVARIWRVLKLFKWNGFGHDPRAVGLGELVLFCLACPQKGVNLDLEIDKDIWKYSWTIIMDGNFKAKHMHDKKLDDQVFLMDGMGYMVGRKKYHDYLKAAKEAPKRLACNNHREVNQANTHRHKLEATGIGGCACARHGCFIPHPLGDFQKGERYKIPKPVNMDYALSHALRHNMAGIQRVLTFYDINCQYMKNFQQRISSNSYLSMPAGISPMPSISLWHVHSHRNECFS